MSEMTWQAYARRNGRKGIRNRVLANGGTARSRWIWNNASTMTSQIIDTVVFIGIAFGIGFGWLFDPAMIGQLGAMMVGQYLCKFVLAALDTPIFYLLTRGGAKRTSPTAS